MKIDPIVMPIRMWQAGMNFWQGAALAQLELNRCALTMLGLWPSEQLKSLGTGKARVAANRPEAASARMVTALAAAPEPVPGEVAPVETESDKPSAAKPEPVKADAGKDTQSKEKPAKADRAATSRAKPAARGKAGGQGRAKAATRRKSGSSTPV